MKKINVRVPVHTGSNDSKWKASVINCYFSHAFKDIKLNIAWHEEHIWNVSVLQRVRFSSLTTVYVKVPMRCYRQELKNNCMACKGHQHEESIIWG
jgi:hypothetical protein